MKSATHRDIMHSHTTAELVHAVASCPGAADSPWYKWFPAKWLGSSRRPRMSLAAQGAYQNLLDEAWQQPDCGLPADPDELGKMSGASVEEWSQIGFTVANLFENVGGRLFSRRLLMCRYETVFKSDKARKSAEERWRLERDKANNHANALPSHANAMRVDPQSLSLSMSFSDASTASDPSSSSDQKTDIPKQDKPDGERTWKTALATYTEEYTAAVADLLADSDWILDMARLNPGIDIPLTIEKAGRFWGSEAGWTHKKRSRVKRIDWRRTMENALTQRQNRVYLSTQPGSTNQSRRPDQVYQVNGRWYNHEELQKVQLTTGATVG